MAYETIKELCKEETVKVDATVTTVSYVLYRALLPGAKGKRVSWALKKPADHIQ